MNNVRCDNCGSDISCSGNSIDYRLHLMNVELPPCGNSVTAMMIYPPIKKDADFCGLGCLKSWVDAQLTPNALREPHAENNATNDGEPRT